MKYFVEGSQNRSGRSVVTVVTSFHSNSRTTTNSPLKIVKQVRVQSKGLVIESKLVWSVC